MRYSAIDHISPFHLQISVSREIEAFQRTENLPTPHACIKRPLFNSVIEQLWLDIDGHGAAKCGSLAPRSRRHKAVLGPVALTPGYSRGDSRRRRLLTLHWNWMFGVIPAYVQLLTPRPVQTGHRCSEPIRERSAQMLYLRHPRAEGRGTHR